MRIGTSVSSTKVGKTGRVTVTCALLWALVGCDLALGNPGTGLAGTVRIPGPLRPLLPKDISGETVKESEPNDEESLPAGSTDPSYQRLFSVDAPLEVGGASATITGSVGPDDLRDRFVIVFSRSGSVTLLFRSDCEGDAATRVIFDDGDELADDNSQWDTSELIWGKNDGDDPTIAKAAVAGGQDYIVHLRHYADATGTGTCNYTLTVAALAGTVVGTIYVGAFTNATPFVVNDPLENGTLGSPISRLPIHGTAATDLALDVVTGDLTGTFKGIFIRPNRQVFLYAFADNDGSNAGTNGAALNFTVNGPPSSADFVMKEAVAVDVGDTDVTDLELLVNTEVTDSDFDGVDDVDDNCPSHYNPTPQTDTDSDGRGNVCDNCPQVENPGQENEDDAGRGDACNGVTGGDPDDTTIVDETLSCPLMFLRQVPQCSLDTDYDEIDDSHLLCPDEQAVCAIEELVSEPLDNCPNVKNTDQDDNDGDAFDEYNQLQAGENRGGDACDNDDDNDGILDADDNCPLATNDNQADGDNDTVGNACDNCPTKANDTQDDADEDEVGDACDKCPNTANPEQENLDGDAQGDACDPDMDGDGYKDKDLAAGDTLDNCPEVSNANQTDTDGDGAGDVCDVE